MYTSRYICPPSLYYTITLSPFPRYKKRSMNHSSLKEHTILIHSNKEGEKERNRITLTKNHGMSRLVVSLSTLSHLAKDPIAARYPIRCRLLTQFQDLEVGDTNNGSLKDRAQFCTVSLRDIALLQREQEEPGEEKKHGICFKDGVYFYMNETVYSKLFIDQISYVSNGDPVEVDVVLWVGKTVGRSWICES